MEKVNFIFLILALVAEMIGTVAGFGSSVFFVPIANFYFSFHDVLALTALFHVFSNLSKITLFRKGVDPFLVIYLGVPAIAFVILGGLIAKKMSDYSLELFLGFFLMIISLIFFKDDLLKLKRGKFEAILGGTLSGFLAGVLGTGGAIRGLTMAAFNLEKSAFIATSAIIDFGVDFSRTVIYYINGFVKKELLIFIPFLILISIIGTWVGKVILQSIPQVLFRKISLTIIFFIGVITLVSAFLKIYH